MSVFDKLAFWKKKEDFKDFGADMGLGSQMDPGMGHGHDFGNFAQNRNAGLDQNMNLGTPDDTGFGNMGGGFGAPPGQPSSMQQPFGAPIQPQTDFKSDKFEVVSAKLDSIRYTLESINQRLASLERVAYEEEKKRGW
jgi:hypothetical protein